MRFTRPAPARRRSSARARSEAPRTWLLVASSSRSVAAYAEAIRDLAAAGHVVRLGYRGSWLPTGMPRGRHRLGTYRRGPLGVLTTALTSPLGTHRQLDLAARRDRWLTEVAEIADEVVLLDETAVEHLGDRLQELAPQARHWPPAEAGRLLTEEAAWRSLTVGARLLDSRLPGGTIALSRVLVSAQTLREVASEGPLRADLAREIRPELRRLSRWALRRGSFDQVLALLDVSDQIVRPLLGPDPLEDDASAALRAHVALVRQEHADPTLEAGVPELARAVLDHADAALAQDDLREASELAAIALGLLFHQQLHTARPRTPLVEDTDSFLAPLRQSRVGQLLATRGRPLGPESLQLEPDPADAQLAGPEPTDPEPTDPEPADPEPPTAQPTRTPTAPGDGPLRVSMLPGAYANHAVPLLAALDADERVELTTVRPHTAAFRGMMIDAALVQHRLEHALGRVPTVPLGVTQEEYDAVVGADVVVADWADKGAVWVSTVLPEHARMVVRVHSVDVLSAPAQLLDWSRVDDLVFVADHIRDLFRSVLGERVAHVRMHVVTNIVPPERFPDPLLPDASRTLGIVGWAQMVKDPVFALDVLEELLAGDDRWRLRLIGSDFGAHHAGEPSAYAAGFRERALSPALVDHIDYVGFTRDLPRHLRHVGFVLSSSLREGCPVGTLEGTAAGAFPVVRDWPAFARYDGARRLFPLGCVVTTPSEAAALIRSLADEEDRRRATEQVRGYMSEQFSSAGTKDRLLDVIVGPL